MRYLHCCNQTLTAASSRGARDDEVMKTRNFIVAVSMVCLLAFAAGCVERRVVYVPNYQYRPTYPAQTVYPAQQPPATNDLAAAASPVDTNAPPTNVTVTQAPPPPQVEVVPVAPGPDFYWVPGYWYWGGGGWVWFGGRWTIRPWHSAIWVRGGWLRGRGGWRWHGGHWR